MDDLCRNINLMHVLAKCSPFAVCRWAAVPASLLLLSHRQAEKLRKQGQLRSKSAPHSHS